MLRRTIPAFLVIGLLAATPFSEEVLIGFSEAGSDAQHALEDTYDSHLNAEDLDNWMKFLTNMPQPVGSPKAKENAEFVASLFESWGFETEIEVFHVLFPTPVERQLELIAPTKYTAVLSEPALDEDKSSQKKGAMLPPYNAYSADGDVTGELIFVNQGIPRDYEELERRGISVEGKIVIAKYGGSWRGIKPKVAFEHGAIACILYSDPRDDGYFQGDVYPKGAYKMERGVQRGSVADMPQYPGDPLTPFVGAKEDTERMTPEESPTVMKIPVLPISYEDAQPLLEALEGPVAPAYWRGALPITYHIGPGPAQVHLKLKFSWDIVPAYNVIARMEGSEFPDEWIMRGNHRDGWVFGAADPTSGQVAMLAEAQAIGELAKAGFRPKRTIMYGSWDAEEPGLLGSTEWVEYHRDEIDQKMIAYLNTDGSGRGFLGMGGSHTMQDFINQVARDVSDPQTGVTVLERRRARDLANGSTTTPEKGDIPINPLGSGSDYSPYLQHMGIASLNIGFGGENGGGSYHTAYDTYEHYKRFGDPDFSYGVTLAKMMGRSTLRLANAEVLPFRFETFVGHVETYVKEIEELVETTRAETLKHNRLVESGAYALAMDPKDGLQPPKAKSPVPHISFASVNNAVVALRAAAKAADSAVATAEASDHLNVAIAQLERAMTSDEGLPRRPWFRHQVYAPGFYTGYGVKTLPGIREAAEELKWDEMNEQMIRVAAMMNAVTDAMNTIKNAASMGPVEETAR
ncbi:MAG: transferrin receptor-like dimerization domain-containing protein [Rhodothermales bacterium]|nr:transferrin receptor-like dimerization domain-containing protein [Rhodothermales bacterium]MDG2016255.1 transferrin receptor-like dimerization domain-containing protein [Rhodothermales bacterium]HAY36602.1 folate hydrolase [Bacteroidota bacterium]